MSGFVGAADAAAVVTEAAFSAVAEVMIHIQEGGQTIPLGTTACEGEYSPHARTRKPSGSPATFEAERDTLHHKASAEVENTGGRVDLIQCLLAQLIDWLGQAFQPQTEIAAAEIPAL